MELLVKFACNPHQYCYNLVVAIFSFIILIKYYILRLSFLKSWINIRNLFQHDLGYGILSYSDLATSIPTMYNISFLI